MKIPKILLNLSKFSDSKFQTKAEAIQAAMTGNANFPAPVPKLAELADAINAFSDALSAAQSRDKTKVAIKNNMRAELSTVLVNMSAYVNQIAAGDRSILVSSGYDISSDSLNLTTLGPCENFQVQTGANPGEIISSVNGVSNKRSYIHEYTPDPLAADSAWVQVYSSKSKITITGLQSLKKYWFRIIVTGSHNRTVQTDAISKSVV